MGATAVRTPPAGTQAAAPDIQLEGVTKRFGDTVAVDALDLEIPRGTFFALLGPSGCGKTTTLRMIGGFEEPTEGSIRLAGKDVTDVPPFRRDVNTVFQSYALFPHLDVGRNVAFGLERKGVGKDEARRRVAEVLELTQLTGMEKRKPGQLSGGQQQRVALARALVNRPQALLLDEPLGALDLRLRRQLQLGGLLPRKPRQLSGGQQQRVALGRALVRDPRVFLLDEPLSNLDAKLRHHMRAELIELHRRLGRTFVYVTHDQLEAMTMSSRIAVMHEGALQQLGTPSEVYGRPANLFVASFIGSPAMNLLHGRVAEGVFRHAALSLPCTGVAEGTQVVLGLRPEDVTLGTGPFSARVRLVEPTGHEQIAALDIEGGEKLTIRADAEVPLRAGETLAWGVRAARLHLFDAASGRRLAATLGPG